MLREEILKKIAEKKEFSQLPKKDIEMAYAHFERRQTSDEDKIKLTRNLLREIFSAFTSIKLLTKKHSLEPEWVLKKHLSTRERFFNYLGLYKKLLKEYKKVSVVDLGAGTNGFSYNYFKESGIDVEYLGVESIGQLVQITDEYFRKNKFRAKITHASLFETETVKTLIKKTPTPRVIFLFKVLDSLEMLRPNSSKEILLSLAPLADKIVVSFATESMIKRTKFKVKRTWFTEFVSENFLILDDFELGKERYIVFSKKT